MLRPRRPAAGAVAPAAAQPAQLAGKGFGGVGAKVVTPGASPFATGRAPPVNSVMAAREEAMKQRQEELKNRREKEEGKRLQHSAAFTVRKVIQRMRVAEPAKFPELVEELEAAQLENTEAMGELADVVREEAEKALQVAEERFKALEEKKIAKEKAEEEKKQKAKEIEERLGNIIIEATQEVEDAEAKVASAIEESAALSDCQLSPDATLEAVAKIEEAVASAKEVHTTATASLKKHRDDAAKARGCKEASQITAQLVELQKRLHGILSELAPLPEAMKTAKERAARKATALQKEAVRKEAFSKHDKDKDGKLNRKEVIAFAKVEYDFDLEAAVLDKMLGKIPGGKSGVMPDRFQQLRSLISMEKSVTKARIAKAEADELERVRKIEEETQLLEREEKKAVILASLEEADQELGKAEEFVPKAKKFAQKLAPNEEEEQNSSAIIEAADAVEAEVTSGNAALAACVEILNPLKSADETDEALAAFRDAQLSKRQSRIKSFRAQLDKVSAQAKEARDGCARMLITEMEIVRLEILPCILATMKAESKTAAELFKAAANDKGAIGASEFATLLKSLSGRAPSESVPESLRPDTIDESQVQKLFLHIAAGSGDIGEEGFIRSMTKLYFRIVKSTVITAEAAINSKAKRKLEPGELLEIFEGPVTEQGLKRMRAKALQDDQEGWVTIAGSKGSVFVEEVSAYYTCIKENNLAVGAKVSEKTARKIIKGENAQMLEPEHKDPSCAVLRMKVRMLRDDAIGWVTTTGSRDDLKFFVPC